MAINGIQDAGSDYEDMFNSGAENYPWLAIDLGFLYKVSYIFFGSDRSPRRGNVVCP